MGFLKRKIVIKSYPDFWNWFKKHEKRFYKIVREHRRIEEVFFKELSTALEQLDKGFYFLVGMADDQTAELIFTAEGAIHNLVFVEDIVAAAPEIPGWKFTAHKQPGSSADTKIILMGYEYSLDTLSFYANEHPDKPDLIDITVVYEHYNPVNAHEIIHGFYIFLDNFLGDIKSLTMIDSLNIISPSEAEKERISFIKLPDYLMWREKEFVEKYEDITYVTADHMVLMEYVLGNGMSQFAAIKTDLLNWDAKMSHPWMAKITIEYDGRDSGLPDERTLAAMNNLEDDLLDRLHDFEWYLYIGRETGMNKRHIYFACKEFRTPSKVLYEMKYKYQAPGYLPEHKDNLDMTYELYKDKYWTSLEHFR